MLLHRAIRTAIEKHSHDDQTPEPIKDIFLFSKISEPHAHDVIRSNLALKKFCIIRGKDINGIKRIADILKELLGEPLTQNGTGITEMKVTPVEGCKRYINNRDAQPIHTDNGHELHGPDFIALTCMQPSPKGGETILVTLKSLLNYLSMRGANIELLYDPKAITYLHESSRVAKKILSRADCGTTSISFSVFADAIIGATKECEDIFMSIIEFLHSPSNQMRFLLGSYDIAVIDNRCVLHGRSAFEGDRLLLRTWYKSPPLQV